MEIGCWGCGEYDVAVCKFSVGVVVYLRQVWAWFGFGFEYV